MPFAGISLGKRRVKSSKSKTRSSLCSSASRSCGRSMSRMITRPKIEEVGQWPVAGHSGGNPDLMFRKTRNQNPHFRHEPVKVRGEPKEENHVGQVGRRDWDRDGRSTPPRTCSLLTGHGSRVRQARSML